MFFVFEINEMSGESYKVPALAYSSYFCSECGISKATQKQLQDHQYQRCMVGKAEMRKYLEK